MALIKHIQRKGMKVISPLTHTHTHTHTHQFTTILLVFSMLQVGLGLKLSTPVEDALPYAAEIDSVIILTAEPGSRHSSGQTTNKNSSMQKVETLQQACPGLDVKTDGWDRPSELQVSFDHSNPKKQLGLCANFCIARNF